MPRSGGSWVNAKDRPQEAGQPKRLIPFEIELFI